MEIAILTRSFPFGKGEQFFEDELYCWAYSEFSRIWLLPAEIDGAARQIPENVTIDLSLAKGVKWGIVVSIFKALVSSVYWNEIKFIYKKHYFSIYPYFLALVQLAKATQLKGRLESFIRYRGSVSIVYCYWNDIQAYAACLAKMSGKVKILVSRVHGFDLYEERRKLGYMPLKRQFVRCFDKIYPVSREGGAYLKKIFYFTDSQIEISPLGVVVPSKRACVSPGGYFHVLSVSFCTSVKRIDKIIDSLACFAIRENRLQIRWWHFGDGPLLTKLRKRAKRRFSGIPNVVYEFKGFASNACVRNFYLDVPIDVFVNASDYEGIPVSMMEAMSYGVPVIAPHVGGIPEIVSFELGVLLNKEPCVTELVSALSEACRFVKTKDAREACCISVMEKYNSNINYSRFVRQVSALLTEQNE